MARSLIQNVSGNHMALPFPYRGVLKAGAATIVGDDNATVIANLGGSDAINGVFAVRGVAADAALGPQDGASVNTATATKEALTFAVNYNDPNAVDAPASGVLFSTQAAIDSFLATRKATNFKHVQLCYNALPDNILHVVTFNMAAGVHRPHPTLPSATVGWAFNTKICGPAGALSFIGAASSTYNPVYGFSSPLTITASQTNSADPFIDFSGTPFAVAAWAQSTPYVVGQRVTANGNTYQCRVAGTSSNSGTGPSGVQFGFPLDGTASWDFICTGTNFLRGNYAILSTGQVCVIHDNTSSRLNLIQALSPASPAQLLMIARPSTIMRNSADDSTAFFRQTGMVTGTNNLIASGVGNRTTFQDIMFDPWSGGSNGFSNGAGTMNLLRFVYDADTIRRVNPGQTSDGNAMSSLGGLPARAPISWNSVIFSGLAQQSAGGVDNLLTCDGGGTVRGSYLEGSEDAINLSRQNFYLFIGNILQSVGFSGNTNLDGALTMESGARLDLIDVTGFPEGRPTEFRGMRSGLPGVIHFRGGFTRPDFQRAVFKNNPIPAVYVGVQGNLNLSQSNPFGYIDGGGNTSFGIDVAGPGALVNLNTATNVTGTAGDTRIAGVATAYTAIPSGGVGDSNTASAARRA